MHPDEVETDAALVRRLLAAQSPRGRGCRSMVAWKLLTPETRGAFRTAPSVDDATWER